MRRLLPLVLLLAALGGAPAAADGPPAAVMAVAPDGDAARGVPVTFDGRDSANAVQWVWDFGDGAQAVGPVVSHTYDRGGAWVVQLLVRNAAGDWAKQWREVRVAPYVQGKVTETIAVPTRAGVTLRGTVTRPDAPGPFPTILEYGPYGTGGVGDGNWNRSLVRSGYAFVKVAMPGRSSSDGEFDMFGQATAEAGYDTVEWIADQSWSDGKVAMTGFSGPAVAAFATLTTRPPHLVTAALKGSFADFYRDEVHVGGTTNSNTFVAAWNALFYGEVATTQSPEAAANAPFDVTGQTKAFADMARPLYDDWWRRRTFVDTPLDIPVLYYGTHRDLWPRSAPEILDWVRPAGGRVSLIYGGHGPVEPTGFNVAMHTGEGGYGESALGETRAWFDHHLLGADNRVDKRAPLSLLVPRDADWNARSGYDWLGLRAWPDPATRWLTLPLGTDGATSALGGAGWGATGSAEVDGLQQVVFTSAPLDQDVTVAGPVTLRLFAELAGADAAWNVVVEQVRPDGSVAMVNDGALQASHRALDEQRTERDRDGRIVQPYHRHTALDPVVPGAVTEYAVEIPAVFNTFTAGSRIRLRIAANDARPVLDGHATAPQSVQFTVHHSPTAPSELVLPVLDKPSRLRLPLPYQR